jgi:hypothetical protein
MREPKKTHKEMGSRRRKRKKGKTTLSTEKKITEMICAEN